MEFKYLKKSKMYKILKSLLEDNVELTKDVSYEFYRGSEWLQCKDTDFRTYKLYRERNFISLDIEQYSEKIDNYVSIERRTYRLNEGQVKKVMYTKSDNLQEKVGYNSILDSLRNNKDIIKKTQQTEKNIIRNEREEGIR